MATMPPSGSIFDGI